MLLRARFLYITLHVRQRWCHWQVRPFKWTKKKAEALHGPQKSKSVVAVNQQNAARSDAPSCGVKWATACNVII